jgi:hypothetical protein
MRSWLVVGWVVLFLAAGLRAATELELQTEGNLEDSKVFAVVLEDTIRAVTDTRGRVPAGESRPLFVVDKTPAEMPWPWPCSEDEPMRRLPTTLARPEREDTVTKDRQLPAAWLQPGALSDSVLAALVRSFDQRNTAAHVIASIPVSGVVLVPVDRQRALMASPGGLIELSLPGYADQEVAVVFARYHCGFNCGSEYLFILKRQGTTWRTFAKTGLDIH